MDTQVKRKVTVKINYDASGVFKPPSRNANSVSRPNSPTKFHSTAPPSPPLKPRAKVNSSATIAISRAPKLAKTTSVGSMFPNGSRTAPGTPARAPSPFKPPEIRSGRSSPAPRARQILHSPSKSTSTVSVPSSPRQKAFIHAPPSERTLSTPTPRVRHASISSSSHFSTSSSAKDIRRDTQPAPSVPTSPIELPNVSNVVRVKAKISGLAKTKPSTPQPLAPRSPSPVAPVPSPPTRSKAQVIYPQPTSASPAAQTPPFYPITTASPAANAHRFATSRPSPPAKSRPFQPFARPESSVNSVDPALVPLPPVSPPSSHLSFSSRSSVSLSAAGGSNVSPLNAHIKNFTTQDLTEDVCDDDAISPLSPRHGLTGMVSRSRSGSFASVVDGGGYHDDVGDGHRKMRAEAKSNRKIADLEITNKSLLAINATLEATKHKQAKEIRDLRRKLRESRLILPPRAYRAVQSSLSSEDEDEDEDEDEENDEIESEKTRDKHDDTFQRVKSIIAGLLESGRRALETTTEDLQEHKGGAKVLHETEVLSWQAEGRSRGRDNLKSSQFSDEHDYSVGEDHTSEEEETSIRPLYSNTQLPHISIGNNTIDSETEVEKMVNGNDRTPLALPVHSGPYW
ncbi:hypothetical protein BD410DRAFT_824842 [Rickenella mellea]|uniref:Uncharacterized protein n=1 Tax=Rickenella mellea TaxID=50990 RepID=A0A4Y7QLH6_9AGAM|nr:hypothetical protein BD410DRAFT_824842 [Rickenella mellea]